MIYGLADKDTLLQNASPATPQKGAIILNPAEQLTCKYLARLLAGPYVREPVAVLIVDCTVVTIRTNKTNWNYYT